MLRDAARLQPIEEFHGGARIGAARVRIADIGGEEFKEAIGGALADGGDEGGGAVGDGDNELVHGLALVSFRRLVLLQLHGLFQKAFDLFGRLRFRFNVADLHPSL